MLVARYNDLASVDERLEGNETELAAIIVEPIGANMGLVQPADGFLEGLLQRARRAGALLIFDEVITWLRFGLRGAQGRTSVVPDLTALGKIMGGGLPIAAFGGRRDAMAVLAPDGTTFTGGTHGGNPFCVAMAHRVLDLLEAHPEYYSQTDGLARRLAGGLREIFTQRGLPYTVVQQESVVDFKFRAGPAAQDYDDACSADRAAYARYCVAMLERGVLLAPSQNEVMFLSTAHTPRDVDETLAAAEVALGAVAARNDLGTQEVRRHQRNRNAEEGDVSRQDIEKEPHRRKRMNDGVAEVNDAAHNRHRDDAENDPAVSAWSINQRTRRAATTKSAAQTMLTQKCSSVPAHAVTQPPW